MIECSDDRIITDSAVRRNSLDNYGLELLKSKLKVKCM